MPDAETRSWPRQLLRGWVSASRQFIGRGDDVEGSVRTVSVALLANLVVAVAKYVGFFLSGSSAMLAESVHSTAVTINQGLLLRGKLASERPETRQHQFGFGPERYFWAFVVSTVMFGVGSVVSIGRGALSLAGEGGHLDPVVAFIGLTVGLVMDGWSFVVAVRQTRKDKGEQSYRQHVQRARDPEVPVVLLEDAAAMVGLLFAYLGVGLAAMTGNHTFDAVASILIGVLLALVASVLARKMKSLLIGEPATEQQQRDIRRAIDGHDAVVDIGYVRTLYLGPDDLLVEAKATFRPELAHNDIARTIDEIESAIRDQVPSARIVAIEPDLPVPGDADAPGGSPVSAR